VVPKGVDSAVYESYTKHYGAAVSMTDFVF